MEIYYRVANIETKQGLWYDQNGSFTGLIHDELNFCKNKDLKMDFDPEIVGWLSATKSIDDLFNWFSLEDIIELQKKGWYVYAYHASDSKHYEKFNHTIIKGETAKVIHKVIFEC